jgi:hypothetical protein
MAVNSWTSWGKLKEVWLGDVYPASWYDHLAPEVRDAFYKLTEITKEDLDKIQKKIESFGVTVARPRYDSIDDFITAGDQLIKPEICPRDRFAVYGNTLWAINMATTRRAWQHELSKHNNIQNSIVSSVLGPIFGANTVRVGRDIYIDIFYNGSAQNDAVKQLELDDFKNKVAPLFPADSRLHLLNNGGHVDGCFAVLHPKLLMTSRYFSAYDQTFPGWEKIELFDPTYKRFQRARKNNSYNGRWDIPGTKAPPSFNEHVLKYAQDWIGNYEETYFEVNCLVIDEKNILFLDENEAVFRRLEEHGITAHSLPFRARTFWDGGLHCITLDTVREDGPLDLFPDRTQRIYDHRSS